VTSIKPIAPDTKRRALLRRLAKKIVTRLDLALVNRDVIHARNGKKRRKPAKHHQHLRQILENLRSLKAGKDRL